MDIDQLLTLGVSSILGAVFIAGLYGSFLIITKEEDESDYTQKSLTDYKHLCVQM